MKFKSLVNPVMIAILSTIIAASARSLHAPLTKLLSAETGAIMSLSFMCFGIGVGMLVFLFFGRKSKAVFDPKRHLQRNDIWKVVLLIILSLIANVLIIMGLQQETAAAGSILQNVSTIATVVFAALFLHEKIPKRLGVGGALIILGSLAISITNAAVLSFSTGSLLIIAGNVAMGASYVVTKLLANRNPIENVLCRGFGVAVITFVIASCLGEQLPSLPTALGLMGVGFLTSGFSTMLLQYGQRSLGAAKAGVIYGLAPLLGVIFAIPLLGEMPGAAFIAALILFIPGMYFVITKNSGKTADKTADEVVREDAEFITSISEEKKSGMRNQLTSFGFLIVAMFFVLMVLGVLSSGTSDAIDVFSSEMLVPGLIFGILLLIAGTILLILGKRVLTAVTFILLVPGILSFVIMGNNPILSAVSGIFSIIFSLILLTSNDPQKYAFAAVNALLGAAFISYLFNDAACGIIVSIASVFLIWLSISSGTGKLQHIIAKHLTEDGGMTFSRCGAVIGFLLIAQITTIELVYDYLMDAAIYSTDAFLALGTVNALLTAFVGAMLLFIGKRQMTAVFFFGAAAALLFELFCDGTFLYLPVIFELVFGLLVVLRGASLILPTALLFGDAFAILLYIQSETIPEVQTAMLLLSLMCAAVALYLSFAVFSEKPKLPVF